MAGLAPSEPAAPTLLTNQSGRLTRPRQGAVAAGSSAGNHPPGAVAAPVLVQQLGGVRGEDPDRGHRVGLSPCGSTPDPPEASDAWPVSAAQGPHVPPAIPIPPELALELSADVARFAGETVVTDGAGRSTSTWAIERAVRSARKRVPGMPEGFQFHDLRHYLASLLIASGVDVKVVQTRLRHASAKTTLDTYGHPWPDADEFARAAVGLVLAARADSVRTRATS